MTLTMEHKYLAKTVVVHIRQVMTQKHGGARGDSGGRGGRDESGVVCDETTNTALTSRTVTGKWEE